MTFMDLLERLMYKITSGRFIVTCVVAGVFGYMAINGVLKEDRTMEIILIVVYAYFSRPRTDNNGDPTNEVGAPPNRPEDTNTTTTLPPK
jgi:hypothetical protein